MDQTEDLFDVVVIGAGPSGAVSASMLVDLGYRVLVLEKQYFPRFSIGESLLPQSMEFLQQAGMLQDVVEAGFQYKNGAAFAKSNQYDCFDFRMKFSPGWGTTYQVQRNLFDKILADFAAKRGAQIRYGQTVAAVEQQKDRVLVDVMDESNLLYQVEGRFILDGSGFGRVLPRLLGLEKKSNLNTRISLYTHIEDNISDKGFDRNKILITVHPENPEIWFWLIPFSNQRASVGVVLPTECIDVPAGEEEAILKLNISEVASLKKVLNNAVFDVPVGRIEGYSSDVTSLYGERFAILGNAGEFLDPVFSSGVTIALKSATLAVQTVDKELRGLSPDWGEEYATPLKLGVNTFRAFVEGWYDGRLQDVIFAKGKNDQIKAMISSILAGYAWDTDNPYVKDPSRLTALAELCRA